MRARGIIPATLLAVMLCGAGASLAQQVLVVDPNGSPGHDFTDLQQAIDAAGEGDILLLRQGFYIGPEDGVVIDGKSLSLIGDSDLILPVGNTGFRIANLGPDQQVTLRGLTISGSGNEMLNNQGFIWAEACRFASATSGTEKQPALDVRRSQNVALLGCVITGFSFFPLAVDEALVVRFSSVFAYDCTFEPGNGQSLGQGASDGEHGVWLGDSLLFASGCTFLGGNGGSVTEGGLPCEIAFGGDGGHGLLLFDQQSTAILLDNTLVGGAAGSAFGPPCPDGLPGLPLLNNGRVIQLTPSARSFEVDGPLRVGETGDYQVTGQPDDLVALFVSAGAEATAWPSLGGQAVIVSLPPAFTVLLDVVPASGVIEGQVTPISLPVGVEGQIGYVQPFFLGAGGEQVLGAAATYVVLDASL